LPALAKVSQSHYNVLRTKDNLTCDFSLASSALNAADSAASRVAASLSRDVSDDSLDRWRLMYSERLLTCNKHTHLMMSVSITHAQPYSHAAGLLSSAGVEQVEQ
jgi:hypothetical protein